MNEGCRIDLVKWKVVMDEKLIDKIELANGLTLEFYDRSKPVAGDRCLVSLVARIDVEVRPEYFENIGAKDLSLAEIRNTLADRATYLYEKKKNFVSNTEKDDILDGFKEKFLSASLGYLSSPDFARKLILSRYKQVKAQLVISQKVRANLLKRSPLTGN